VQARLPAAPATDGRRYARAGLVSNTRACQSQGSCPNVACFQYRRFGGNCATKSHMRVLALIAFGSLLSLPRDSAAQEADQTKRFSGKWEARVKDSVVCAIELHVADNVHGSMAGCHIRVDEDG